MQIATIKCGRFQRRLAFLFSVPLLGCLAMTSSVSGQIYKAANNDNLINATSWTIFPDGTGGNPPFAAGGDTWWFGSGMGADRVLNTGGAIQTGAIRVDNNTGTPNYGVTINGPTITLIGNGDFAIPGGSGNSGLVLNGSVGGNLVINSNLIVDGNQTWFAARNYTINGTVTLDNSTITFRQSAGTASINGAISGTGSLLKDNSALTVLAGNSSYSGSTSVNLGILQVTGTLGGTAGSSTDTGNIVFGGSGSNGTLQFNTVGNLGVASQIRFRNTGGTAGSGGRLEYNGTTNQVLSKTIQSDSSIGIRIASNSVGGSLTVNGTFDQTNRSLYLEGSGTGSNTLASLFAGTGTLNKREAGTWLLTNTNTYSGGTVISGGTLRVNALSGIGTGALTVQNGSTFRYEGSGAESTARDLNMNSGAATVDIVNANANLNFTSVGGTRNGAFTKSGAGAMTIAGNFSGSASIAVTGGSLRLTGASNTHSGTTSVSNGGALIIDGTHTGGGNYSINDTSKLMGTGSIGANVVLGSNATLAPGNSIGTLTVNGNLTLGGTYEWEVQSGTSNADLVNVVGNIDLTGSNLNLVELGTIQGGQKFTLFGYTGALVGTFANMGSFAQWTINYADASAGLNGGSGAQFVTLTAVPEPTALLLVAGAVGIGFVRRRRA
ncbi:MAG: autotransporter-associated beta strand repeat-containing protein [Planctomycetaceae bacterium]|nr:autotransporter-associated beta strand repeat-containing protein [Planctomycetaceae bacterium]